MFKTQLNLLLIEKSSNNGCYSLLKHREDVSVTLANNENEAFIALLYTQFKLILLDGALANADIISFVKSAGGFNFKTPVVVMLAAHDSDLKAHFVAAGVDECYLKPLSRDVLDQLINQQKNTASLTSDDYIQILLDKTQNNKSLALTIFKKLFVELPEQINDIKEALQNRQYQSALDITHKLHGSVSFCGFIELQHVAANLENCLLRKDYQALKLNFIALRAAILNFVAQENTILNAMK